MYLYDSSNKIERFINSFFVYFFMVKTNVAIGLAGVAFAAFIGSVHEGDRILNEEVFRKSGLLRQVATANLDSCGGSISPIFCQERVDNLVSEKNRLVKEVASRYEIASASCEFSVSSPVWYRCQGMATPRTIAKYYLAEQ